MAAALLAKTVVTNYHVISLSKTRWPWQPGFAQWGRRQLDDQLRVNPGFGVTETRTGSRDGRPQFIAVLRGKKPQIVEPERTTLYDEGVTDYRLIIEVAVPASRESDAQLAETIDTVRESLRARRIPQALGAAPDSLRLPQGVEKPGQQGAAGLRHHAPDHLGSMIEPGMAEEVAHRPGHARLGVVRAENHSPDLRQHDGAAALGARLQGDVERGTGEPIRT